MSLQTAPPRSTHLPASSSRSCIAVATAAVDPAPALASRLGRLEREPGRRRWILALGKAAIPMARAAVETLAEWGASPAGGVVVAPEIQPAPHPRLPVVAGDHPEPGPGSLAAAEALGRAAAAVAPEDEVWVLLSGGASSLLAAPVEGLTPGELTTLYRLLLGSGLDITAMNRIRKRFSRWGAGRLARALAPARVRVFVVSDVIGDDLPSIGSGPCVPDDDHRRRSPADAGARGTLGSYPRRRAAASSRRRSREQRRKRQSRETRPSRG